MEPRGWDPIPLFIYLDIYRYLCVCVCVWGKISPYAARGGTLTLVGVWGMPSMMAGLMMMRLLIELVLEGADDWAEPAIE